MKPSLRPSNTPLLRRHERFTNLLSDNSKFKKGMTAFQISVWGRDKETMKVTVSIRELEIQSFGKKQGTATSEENGEFLQHLLYPDITILAHNIEDAREMAAEVGLDESERGIAATLRNSKSWVAEYDGVSKPEIVARVKGEVAYLETATPSFGIIEG